MRDGAQADGGLTLLAFSSCVPHALGCPGFYAEFGQGMRARAGKTSWCILPWAAREPGGAEVPVCLRCKQVLLICCLFVFLQSLECGGSGDGVSPLCGGRVRLLEVEVRKHREAAGTCFGRERFFSAIYDN